MKHSNECDALPNWRNARCIKENIDKTTRIALEAAVLEVAECMYESQDGSNYFIRDSSKTYHSD